MHALKRFGIPQAFVNMVEKIYQQRHFFVTDSGITSDLHPQHFGISQGCPLSPFLFIIVMTVLMEDAKKQLSETFGDILSSTLPFHELLYADDTLLIDVSGENLERFMTIVAKLGSEYGLKLNWKKIEDLSIR